MKLAMVLNSVAAALIGGLFGATSCLVGAMLLLPSSDERPMGWRHLVVPFLLGAMFGLMFWRAARAIAGRRGGGLR
jgi:hypothetical protein